jgi:hypothetical protein
MPVARFICAGRLKDADPRDTLGMKLASPEVGQAQLKEPAAAKQLLLKK